MNENCDKHHSHINFSINACLILPGVILNMTNVLANVVSKHIVDSIQNANPKSSRPTGVFTQVLKTMIRTQNIWDMVQVIRRHGINPTLNEDVGEVFPDFKKMWDYAFSSTGMKKSIDQKKEASELLKEMCPMDKGYKNPMRDNGQEAAMYLTTQKALFESKVKYVMAMVMYIIYYNKQVEGIKAEMDDKKLLEGGIVGFQMTPKKCHDSQMSKQNSLQGVPKKSESDVIRFDRNYAKNLKQFSMSGGKDLTFFSNLQEFMMMLFGNAIEDDPWTGKDKDLHEMVAWKKEKYTNSLSPIKLTTRSDQAAKVEQEEENKKALKEEKKKANEDGYSTPNKSPSSATSTNKEESPDKSNASFTNNSTLATNDTEKEEDDDSSDEERHDEDTDNKKAAAKRSNIKKTIRPPEITTPTKSDKTSSKRPNETPAKSTNKKKQKTPKTPRDETEQATEDRENYESIAAAMRTNLKRQRRKTSNIEQQRAKRPKLGIGSDNWDGTIDSTTSAFMKQWVPFMSPEITVVVENEDTTMEDLDIETVLDKDCNVDTIIEQLLEPYEEREKDYEHKYAITRILIVDDIDCSFIEECLEHKINDRNEWCAQKDGSYTNNNNPKIMHSWEGENLVNDLQLMMYRQKFDILAKIMQTDGYAVLNHGVTAEGYMITFLHLHLETLSGYSLKQFAKEIKGGGGNENLNDDTSSFDSNKMGEEIDDRLSDWSIRDENDQNDVEDSVSDHTSESDFVDGDEEDESEYGRGQESESEDSGVNYTENEENGEQNE